MSRTDTTTPMPAAPDPARKPVAPIRPGTALRPGMNAGGTSKPPSSGGGGGSGGDGRGPGGSSGGMPPIDQLQGRPLGRVLTKMGKVTREQVVEALNFQKSKGGALGRILIDLGYVKEVDVNFALAAQLGYEFVNLEGKNITPEMIKAVPQQIATTQKVLPIAFDPVAKKLTIAMANHENFRAIDDLRSLMGYDVRAVLAESEQLEKLINKHYQAAAEGISDI